MGKPEVGTPKYLANKMKAKGLQKLRWYCQMCQKQCRDENGFKCHTMSEAHQRQLLLFADNPKKYMDEFSYEFSKGFLDILRHQYNSKRVLANRVYQEYISERNHLHMNSTRWLSLTTFVQWLGKTGKCEIEDTEKGWFITYIDRDPFTIAQEEKQRKKEKLNKDDDEKSRDFIEKQIQIGLEKDKVKVKDASVSDPKPSELIRTNEDEKIVIPLKFNMTTKTKVLPVSNKSVFKPQKKHK